MLSRIRFSHEDAPANTPAGSEENNSVKPEVGDTYVIGGKEYTLTKDQVTYLITKGAYAALNDDDKTVDDSVDDKTVDDKTVDDKEEVISPALQAKIDALEKKINDFGVQANREKIENTFKNLADTYDLTKSDKDMRENIIDLVRVELYRNPNLDIAASFKKRVEFFSNKILKNRKEYIEDKAKDSDKTKGAGEGSTASDAPDVITGDDLLSGKSSRKIRAYVKGKYPTP